MDTQRRLLHIAQLVDQKTDSSDKTTQSDSNKTYTIKPGDTLSGIAEELYGKTDAWPQLYSENKEAIGNNPNLIQPGTVLQLPKTLRPLTSQERALMQQQTQKMHNQLLPQSKDPEAIQQEAEKRGLVTLEGLPVKESTRRAQSIYVDPRLKTLLMEIRSGVSDQNGPINAPLAAVTEAWPPTVRHISQSHYTGGAVDFVVHPRTDLAEIRRLVKYMQNRGFRVANEYEESYSTTTGKHIHVAVSSSLPTSVAHTKHTKKRGI